MGQHLLLTIRLHDARYHGMPTTEWPPAPARVFQALVAGAARGRTLSPSTTTALEWLETLPYPLVAAPRASLGSPVDLWVPNNDADSVGGDPARISEIRTRKPVRPRLLEGDAPLLYAWPLPADQRHAASVAAIADDLYQLGRGVDMAWAAGEVVDDEVLAERLSQHPGSLHRPEGSGGGNPLPCPMRGTLTSLLQRHAWSRLRVDDEGTESRLLFSNAPRPRFVPVSYSSPRHRLVFELRDRMLPTKRWSWPLVRAALLCERLRDGAARRLRESMPDHTQTIERVLVGRKADGGDAGPTDERVRIVPLPSIGHEHVDPAIRRVLVEVPSRCPLSISDVAWAFEGLESADPESGVVDPYVLTRGVEDGMLDRYEARAARWCSITPVALPASAGRRRIEPSCRSEQAKGAAERSDEQARVAHAVRTALRHAGIAASLLEVRVQREPFDARGRRAEDFAAGTRFAKERLWHVEVLLARRVGGPLVLGDGRFLGLGVLRPAAESHGILAFDLNGEPPRDTMRLCRAMRRAVMARVQAVIGARPLGTYFSGHERDGSPARGEQSTHLGFQFDPACNRLLVLAPHVMDHREVTRHEARELEILADALDDMTDLHAAGGHALVRRRDVQEGYRTSSRIWTSANPYVVTRHRGEASAARSLEADVLVECARRGLPKPTVTVRHVRSVAGSGLEGRVRLQFAVGVAGPLVLGRSRYLGGGWFVPHEVPTCDLLGPAEDLPSGV